MWDLGIPSCTLIAIPDAHPEGYFLKKETRVTERSNTSEKIEKLSAVTEATFTFHLFSLVEKGLS